MPTDLEALRKFAKAVLADWPEGCMDDCGKVHDLAVECGLLKGITVTEPCGEYCSCAEYNGRDGFPMTCYRRTAVLTGESDAD